MTFTGTLKYSDTQSSFETIVGVNPIMICLILRNKRQYVTEDTEYLASKVLNLYLCCLHISVIPSN